MGTWATTMCTAMGNAMASVFNSGGAAYITFLNTAGSGVATCTMSASAFTVATVGASATLTAGAVTTGTATGVHEIGTVLVFNGAAATVGVFSASTAGSIDFVFSGGRGVGAADVISVAGWNVVFSAAT